MVRWRTLLVASLVVLAGCGTVFDGGESAETTDTVTPVPVASTTPEPTPTEGPDLSSYPGVGPGGVPEPTALLWAHMQALSNQSFTVVWSRRVTNLTTGESRLAHRRRAVVENASTYRYLATGSEVPGRVEKYSSPSGRYGRLVRDNGTVTKGRLLDEGESANKRFAQVLTTALTTMRVNATTVSLVERDGQQYVRFYVRQPPDHLLTLYRVDRLLRYQLTLYVHPSGYVRSVHVQLIYGTKHGRNQVDRWIRYTDVGESTVTAPDWVASFEQTGSPHPPVIVDASNGTVSGPGDR